MKNLTTIFFPLNLSKCVILSGNPVAFSPSEFPFLSQMTRCGSLRASLPDLHPHVKVLGTQIGSDHYVNQVIEERVASVVKLHSLLLQLGDPQIILTLIRYCLGACRFIHLLRTVRPVMKEWSITVSLEVRQCLSHLIGTEVGDRGWIQANYLSILVDWVSLTLVGCFLILPPSFSFLIP